MAKDINQLPIAGPSILLRTYKGQVQFANGQVVDVSCQAIDHVTAMIKLAATICDIPVPALAWVMKDETSPIIQAPFTVVPKLPTGNTPGS